MDPIVRENANGLSSQQNILHIHNYSTCAIQSLILEIKKYPIIFNEKTFPASIELIDIAWTRIVTALLDNLDFSQIKYWDQSFREAWKWIRSTFIKDMLEQRCKHVYVRNSKNHWIPQLKFLEPFIELDAISSVEADKALNPDTDLPIIVQSSKCKGCVGIRATESVVISVKAASEPLDSDDVQVCICFQVKGVKPLVLNENHLAIQSASQHLESNENHLAIQSASQHLEVDDSFILEYQSDPMFNSYPNVESAAGLSMMITTLDRQPIRENFQAPSSSGVPYDEDYFYIMSLLPKIKQLEPKRCIEVKKFMLQAALGLLKVADE